MSILDGKFIKTGTILASALEISPDFVLTNQGGVASFITTNSTHLITAGDYNTVLGGQENNINSTGNYNLLISGRNNLIEDSATQVARDSIIIAGGGTGNFQNHIIGSVVSAILGGTGNTIGTTVSTGNFNNFIINSLNSAIGSDSDLVTIISSTDVTTNDAVDNAVGIGLKSYNMEQTSTVYMPKVRLGLGTGGDLIIDDTNTNVLVRNITTGEIEINTNIANSGLTDTDDLLEGSINLYYTESRVTANSSVTTNLAKISADGSISTHSDVSNTSASTSGEALIWTGTEWAPGLIEIGPLVGFEIDGFSFLSTNIAIVDGENGNDATATIGGSAFSTFKAASDATNIAYQANSNDLYLVYVRAINGYYNVIVSSGGDTTYPEIHYYYEPKTIIRSSGSSNIPFGDFTNGPGNYWIHGKGEFYIDPTAAFSNTWAFTYSSNVYLSAAVVQNFGILEDNNVLPDTRAKCELYIDKLLTAGNLQSNSSKDLRGGKLKFHNTDFIGGMTWGIFWQRNATIDFNRCKFRLSPLVHNPTDGTWNVISKDGTTLFSVDMTNANMSRQSRLADFSTFTTIQDNVDSAIVQDSRGSAFEISLDNDTYGLYFTFTDCEFIIDQDKGIGFKIVKSTDADSADKSTINLIRPRFIDSSGGTTTSVVLWKTSLTYSDPKILIENPVSNSDTFRTSNIDSVTNPDILFYDATIATAISYDNGNSGLLATDVQTAIDELAGTAGVAVAAISTFNTRIQYDLLNNNTGYQFKTLQLELTQAEILTLGTSPIEIIPMFLDKFIVPIKGIITTTGRNFYTNQTLELIYEGDSASSYIFKQALAATRPGKRRMTTMYDNTDNPGVYADAGLFLRAENNIDPAGRGNSIILKLLYTLVD